MRERFLNWDYDDNEERQFSDDEEDYEELSSTDDPNADAEELRSTDNPNADADEPHDITIVEPKAGAVLEVTPTMSQSAHQLGSLPGLNTFLRSADDAKPAPEDAVSLEILQSRMPAAETAPPPAPISRSPASKLSKVRLRAGNTAASVLVDNAASRVRLRAGKTAASVLGDATDIVQVSFAQATAASVFECLATGRPPSSRLRAGNRSECLVAKVQITSKSANAWVTAASVLRRDARLQVGYARATAASVVGAKVHIASKSANTQLRLRAGNASASGVVNDVDIRLCTGKPAASGLVNDRRAVSKLDLAHIQGEQGGQSEEGVQTPCHYPGANTGLVTNSAAVGVSSSYTAVVGDFGMGSVTVSPESSGGEGVGNGDIETDVSYPVESDGISGELTAVLVLVDLAAVLMRLGRDGHRGQRGGE
ncbi:hypothetical protein B0H11DRAFT_2266325 [Mycena galericulata]|nr:hypothetical protein B0H11DRAFT_2266325 [Mycena galericulata]